MSEVTWRVLDGTEIFVTKFCTLGPIFINISWMNLELQQLFEQVWTIWTTIWKYQKQQVLKQLVIGVTEIEDRSERLKASEIYSDRVYNLLFI